VLAADHVSFDTTGRIQTGEIEHMNFSGRVALITGAGSPQGIGFATARLLAEQGAKIAITSTTKRIEERARELAAEGADVFALPVDLRDFGRTQC
jgi:3-oxoacyl-[acyl-carrier protein] reductase